MSILYFLFLIGIIIFAIIGIGIIFIMIGLAMCFVIHFNDKLFHNKDDNRKE